MDTTHKTNDIHTKLAALPERERTAVLFAVKEIYGGSISGEGDKKKVTTIIENLLADLAAGKLSMKSLLEKSRDAYRTQVTPQQEAQNLGVDYLANLTQEQMNAILLRAEKEGGIPYEVKSEHVKAVAEKVAAGTLSLDELIAAFQRDAARPYNAFDGLTDETLVKAIRWRATDETIPDPVKRWELTRNFIDSLASAGNHEQIIKEHEKMQDTAKETLRDAHPPGYFTRQVLKATASKTPGFPAL